MIVEKLSYYETMRSSPASRDEGAKGQPFPLSPMTNRIGRMISSQTV